MTHKLITTNNPKKVPKELREKSRKVEKITPEVLDLARDMVRIMNKNKGIGLAAIQVGAPICMIVVKNGNESHTFINPEIKRVSRREVVYNEGCLSFPDLFENVSRPETVKVRAQDISGQDIEIDAEGILARVLLHEIDHLDGIVFLDRIED